MGEHGFLCPDVPEAYGGAGAEMAFRVADRCLQLFGGYGYCGEYPPIARAWKDIHVTRILGGTNEIMRRIIARHRGL
jgi:acyl-CoA dehydrogenase